MTERIELPRLGNWQSVRIYELRHKCWRDRIPLLRTWHWRKLISQFEEQDDGRA